MLGNWIIKIYDSILPMPINERQILVYKRGSNLRAFPYKILKDMLDQNRLHEIPGWKIEDDHFLANKIRKALKQVDNLY